MKLAYINYFYDHDISAEEYPERYPSIHGWCKAISDAGIAVTVFQRFNKNLNFKKDNVSYVLLNDGETGSLRLLKNPKSFHKRIAEDNFDIIHINSLNYVYQCYLLKKKLPSSKFAIQHHAEMPWKGLKRHLQKYFSLSADGFIFSSNGIAAGWIAHGSLSQNKLIAEIAEGSTNFNFQDRKESRAKTGMTGSPVFLWVGRLNENKDPLTALSGFSRLIKLYPQSKLYMIYSGSELENKILSLIFLTSELKNSVMLLGKIDHSLLSDYYNSADYFVLGSAYESTGYSLIEALACGVVPLVTDIPSFGTITANGQIGGLWKCGEPLSFFETAKNILSKNIMEESAKSLNHFKDNLSYDALGEKAKCFYESLAEKQSGD